MKVKYSNNKNVSSHSSSNSSGNSEANRITARIVNNKSNTCFDEHIAKEGETTLGANNNVTLDAKRHEI